MFSAVSKVGSAAANVASSLHLPGTAKKETGFSEDQAFNHIKAITQISSSAQQTPLFQFVLDESESIKKTAKGEVKVEVDRVPAKHGDSVVLRVLPKYASEAKEHNDILVSAHIDTVFSAEGAGDDSSSVAVMLELARGLSQSASGLKHAVIFLFNTGEDEGLNGSHSFITQHPFGNTVNIRLAIDLDSIGSTIKSEATGSKKPVLLMSKISEEGTSAAQNLIFDLEALSSRSSYPAGTIASQDIFSSGIINSGTDFKVYKEIGGASGLDFAFGDHTAVYHTKNDKLELLKPGSLQHLGENMLAFLLQVDSSTFPEVKN